MKNKVFILHIITFLLLLGCGQVSNTGREDENLTQVIINSESGQTIYYLNQADKVQKCEFIDLSGNKVERIYNYYSNGDLQSISRTSNLGENSELYISRECSRSDGKISKKIIMQIDSRNESKKLECIYEYDDSGKICGVVQTDEDGNVQKKSLRILMGD